MWIQLSATEGMLIIEWNWNSTTILFERVRVNRVLFHWHTKKSQIFLKPLLLIGCGQLAEMERKLDIFIAFMGNKARAWISVDFCINLF